MHPWTVYILRCADGTYYTGITRDLDRRLREHNDGKRLAAAYTRSRRPVSVVYREQHDSRSMAQKREAELKQLSRQEKITVIDNAGMTKGLK